MGQTGPLSTFAGFGNLAGAITGFYELTGWPDRAPAGPFLAYTDYVAPRYTRGRPARRPRLAAAHRRRPAPRPLPGRGVDPLPGPGDPRPHGQRRRPDARRQRRPVPRAPRRVPVRRRRRAGWPSPARRRPAAPRSAAWSAALDRRRHRGVDVDAVGRPRSRTRCRPSACRSTACRTAAACWADPQLVHRGHYLTVEHPVHGQCIVEGAARRAVTDAGAWCARANPTMGEHNDHVLRDLLGYDDDRVTELVIAGALG